MSARPMLLTPYVVNEEEWKVVTLRVRFDEETHEPLIVRINAEDLTIDEERELILFLRARV